MPGRPKKARRKDKFEEPKIGKLSKKGRIMTCGVCGEENHNATSCKKRDKPVQPRKSNENRKRKRLEKGKEKVSQSSQRAENSTVVQDLLNTYKPKPVKKSWKEKVVTACQHSNVRPNMVENASESLRTTNTNRRKEKDKPSKPKSTPSGCYVNLKTGVAILNPGTSNARFLYK